MDSNKENKNEDTIIIESISKLLDNTEIKKDLNKTEKMETDEQEEKINETELEEVVKKEPTEEVKELKSEEKVEPKIEEKVEDFKKCNSRKKIYLVVTIFLIILLALLLTIFSTIFAIFNRNSNLIARGITINNINFSNYTYEEALEKIKLYEEAIFSKNINLKYGDELDIQISTEELEFKYNTQKAVDEAFNIGRKNNILIDNYSLLNALFLGKNVELEYEFNEDILSKIIDDTQSKITDGIKNPSYYIEEDKLYIDSGEAGYKIDAEELKDRIIAVLLNRNIENIDSNIPENIEIPVKYCEPEKIDMDKIYSEIYTETKDAYYELNPIKIYKEQNGVDLKISLKEAKEQIKSEKKQEYVFDLIITPAEKTVKSFGIEAFPYKISTFSTNYDASNINRSENLAIAAKKISGIVLMPDEEFSFNTVVGKRTVEEGYKNAKIYQNGSVVDGLAGGICQISSTLYNAVLLANLEVTERSNHSFTTSYIKAGRDATVVYGAKDFKFKNTRKNPIKIEATVEKGVATFIIYGVEPEENEYDIEISTVVTQSIPYSTAYVEDASLAPGAQKVVQVGHAGYKVTTYLEKKQNGVSISKEEISKDTYSPMKTIVHVGP